MTIIRYGRWDSFLFWFTYGQHTKTGWTQKQIFCQNKTFLYKWIILHKHSYRSKNIYHSDSCFNMMILYICWLQHILLQVARCYCTEIWDVSNKESKLNLEDFSALTGLARANIWIALQVWGHKALCHNQCSSFRSYLFFRSALGFPLLWPVAPTPAALAPTGLVQAPFPPHLMGGPPHPLPRATHRDVFVSSGALLSRRKWL